jgi:hypothetical protein
MAVQAASQVPFTPIHQLEIPNAFELLVAGPIGSGPCLHGGRGTLTRYTARFLARSLDLLHVAAAHAADCTRFVSADDRQLAVARASGLETVDINRRVRRPKS